MSLKDLFVEYDAADKEVETRKKALEEALKSRSDVVRRVAELAHPKKRVMRDSKELTIVVRGDTYFFRGAKTNTDKVFSDEVP